jgi:hypothetical protein
MDAQTPHPAPPLSLQDKLDRITQERRVLDVKRELMQHGLHDGDALRHRLDGSQGHLRVLHSHDPHPVVQLEDGTQIEFHAAEWSPPGA